MNIYVADQNPKEGLKLSTKSGKKDNIVVEPAEHSAFYGMATFIKASLHSKTWN